MHGTNTALVVNPLDHLAQTINDAHRSFMRYRRMMVMSALDAGEALRKAKRTIPGDTAFGQWRQKNLIIGQRQAFRYMELARQSAGQPYTSDQLWELWQTIQGNRREKLPPPTPTFTRDDAEYALKIEARTRSDFAGEREVAKGKLEGLAKQYGMTSDELARHQPARGARCRNPCALSQTVALNYDYAASSRQLVMV